MSEAGHTYKIVFVGDTRVGKTSLINYYINREASATTSTLGATSTKIETTWEGHTIAMTVWDTAGQETFRNLVPLYARGAHGAVIVCNQHSLKSWESVAGWYDYLGTVEKTEGLVVVLVVNKCDKPAKIDMNSVYSWASEKNVEVIKTSAVQGTGVDTIFETMAKALAARQDEVRSNEEKAPASQPIDIEADACDDEKQKKKCC